jgi:hypothetical protein
MPASTQYPTVALAGILTLVMLVIGCFEYNFGRSRDSVVLFHISYFSFSLLSQTLVLMHTIFHGYGCWRVSLSFLLISFLHCHICRLVSGGTYIIDR